MCVIIIVELIIRERLVENNLRSLSRGAIRSELIFPVAVIVLLHLLTLVLRELRAGVHQPIAPLRRRNLPTNGALEGLGKHSSSRIDIGPDSSASEASLCEIQLKRFHLALSLSSPA